MKTKTMMERMNEEPADKVLDELEAKYRPKHTPGELKLGREDYAYFEHAKETIKYQTVGIDASNGDIDIARVVIGDPSGEGRANAAELVRRWNTHAELLEACKACADGIDELMGRLVKQQPELLPKDITVYPWTIIRAARTAIEKATQ